MKLREQTRSVVVSETHREDSLAFEQLSSQSVCDSHSSNIHKILQLAGFNFIYECSSGNNGGEENDRQTI